MNLYKNIKNNINEDNLDFIIDLVLKKNNINENTRASSISDDKFDKLVGQIKDILKNHISEKDIRNELAKKLFNSLKENEK